MGKATEVAGESHFKEMYLRENLDLLKDFRAKSTLLQGEVK